MNKKKGFTLVELIAVIVIIAIIALIIVPVTQDVIKKSEKGAVKDSAYGYIKSVENWQYGELQNKEDIYLDGNYTISNGNLNNYKIPLTGKAPKSGYLVYTDDDLISGCLVINGYEVRYQNGKFTVTGKGNCGATEPSGTEPEELEFPESLIVTSGDGLYESTTEPGRLIYRGSNPNNYINIKEDGTNNTLYRIVSYEPDGTIKVVRNESIGSFVWDEENARYTYETNDTFCKSVDGCNVWGNQTNTLYNGESLGDNFHYVYYENANDTTLTNGNSGTVKSDSTLNQYLNSKTSNSSDSWQPAIVLDNYIDNHQWNVGGVRNISKNKGIIKEKEEERQLKWIGEIALLNITEFVEASLNTECKSAILNYGTTSGASCKESNWAFKGISEWSLSPHSGGHDGVWYVSSSGYFYLNNASSYHTTIPSVRPAFYLKSEISLTGEGTTANPYTISGM